MRPGEDPLPGFPGGLPGSSWPGSQSPGSALEQGSPRVSGVAPASRISGPDVRDDTKGLGWLILLPIACCGGPLIVAAIAAAGAAAWGGLAALATIAVGVSPILLKRRRRAASCCPTGTVLDDGWRTGGQVQPNE